MTVTAADINIDGLYSLLLALSRQCDCETELPREDCRVAPLDRWWVALITGVDSDSAVPRDGFLASRAIEEASLRRSSRVAPAAAESPE